MNNKKFCVTLEMTYFMKDHRSLCKLLIDRTKCKQIQDLHDHITKTFKITDFYLKCNNHYLPEKEDIDILQPGDELRVFPKLESRCEKVNANVDSVTELITEEIPDIVEDIQTVKKKRKKRKRILDVEEDPIPSGSNNNGDLLKTDNHVEESMEINVKSRKDNEVEHEKQQCSTMKKQGANWYSKTVDKISFFEGLSEKSDEVSPIEKRVSAKGTSVSPNFKANTLFFEGVRDNNDEVAPKERGVLLKANPASLVSQVTDENESNIQLIEDIVVVPSKPVSSDEITPPPKTTKKKEIHKTTPYPRLPPFSVGGLLTNLTKSSDSDRTIKNGNVYKRENNGIDHDDQDNNMETCGIPSKQIFTIVNKRKRIRVRKRKTLPNVIECNYSNTTPVLQQFVGKTPSRTHIRFDIEEKEDEDLIDLSSEKSVRTDSGIGMNKSAINKSLPEDGNIISFKLLILSENYTPEISDYITATVKKINPINGDVEINVLEGKDQLKTPIGIFTLEDEIEDNQNSSIYNWFKLIEPTIIYP